MALNMQTLVEIDNISKNFGDNILLDRVSFKLSPGQITTLIGQNGAGKTTIARIMLGLETYDSGKLLINKNIRIGYVPQKLDFAFNMPLTSEGLIEILAPGGIKEDLFDISKFIDYKSIAKKDISNISGGQLQKLMIIGTLMNRPDFVILDEPTQFLDVASQQQFYHIIGGLKKSINLTVFMISHDLFTVMKNSDQVICLNGHVCCSGRPSDIYEDKTNSSFKIALSEIGVYVHDHDHDHNHKH